MLLKVNGAVRINRLIKKIDACSHVLEQEVLALNKRVQQLELDLKCAQEELETFYLLSRDQAELLNANAELHERAAQLLVQKFD